MTKVNHLKKLSEIVETIGTCMLTTINDRGEMRARPMNTAEIDDQENIWFFTDRRSEKVDEFDNLQPIMLSYAEPNSNTYLSVTGKIKMVDNPQKKEELFNPMVKAWFPEGTNDPNMTLLKFTPTRAEYWDGTSSTIVQAIKAGAALVKGEKYDYASENHESFSI